MYAYVKYYSKKKQFFTSYLRYVLPENYPAHLTSLEHNHDQLCPGLILCSYIHFNFARCIYTYMVYWLTFFA